MLLRSLGGHLCALARFGLFPYVLPFRSLHVPVNCNLSCQVSHWKHFPIIRAPCCIDHAQSEASLLRARMQLKLLFRLRLGPEPGKRLMFKSVSVLVYLSPFKSSILLYSEKMLSPKWLLVWLGLRCLRLVHTAHACCSTVQLESLELEDLRVRCNGAKQYPPNACSFLQKVVG